MMATTTTKSPWIRVIWINPTPDREEDAPPSEATDRFDFLTLTPMNFLPSVSYRADSKQPTGSDAQQLFHAFYESASFRLTKAPSDLRCLAPGCGTIRVEADELLERVRAQNEDNPDDLGVLYEFSTLYRLKGVDPASCIQMIHMAAVCPQQQCWMPAFERLRRLTRQLLNAPLLPACTGRCSHCFAVLTKRCPAISCYDHCGAAWYCTTRCADAARATHDLQSYACTLIEARRRYCMSCGRRGELFELKKCARCSIAFYCDDLCQRADWATHKKQCVKKVIPDVD